MVLSLWTGCGWRCPALPKLLTLRDGSKVTDARLARLVQFDERSRNFPVRALRTTEQAPRSRMWRCRRALDQGPNGACVGFSMAHELIANPVPVRVRAKFAKQLYREAQKADPWDGGSYPGASPRYEGTSVLAGIKRLKELGYVSEYRWAFSLEDLVMAVGHLGPAVLGIPWDEGMNEPASCGRLHVSGRMLGGHAILCRGVNVKRRLFLLHNSWGPSWAKHGVATIS